MSYLSVAPAGGTGIGTVTQVNSGTGLTGGPITGTGTLSLDTPLQPIASLTGNSLKVLRVNAGETAVEYATITVPPAGSNGQLQYNNSGALGGISGVLTDGVNLGFGTSSPTHSATFASTSTGIALYNTVDQITNYERGELYWNANELVLRTLNGGTGTQRAVRIASRNSVGNQTSIYLTRGSAPFFKLEHDSTGTTGNIYQFTGGSAASSGTYNFLYFNPTIGQSGTASYGGLILNVAESTTGSGSKTLLGLQVNSVDKFSVANTGITTITNTTDLASNQILNLKGARATPAANDEVYQSFSLSSSTGVTREFARITTLGTTITNTSEVGRLRFSVISAGSLVSVFQALNNAIIPGSNDSAALGTSAISWSDLFLASGGVINFNNGNYTLTHSTGLLTASGAFSVGVSNPITAGTIELGDASDTTISRSAAGVIAVEGVVIPSISSINTFTNKRITKRVTALSSNSATPTINTDNCDFVEITAQTNNITSMTTNLSGTPTNGQTLWIALTASSGTPTVAWGASFEDSTATAPTELSTTRVDVGFVWNTATSKWRCVAKS